MSGILNVLLGDNAVGTPSWVQTADSVPADFAIDFINNRAWSGGATVTIASVLTPSTGVMSTYLDGAGLITGGADFLVTSPTFLNTTAMSLFCMGSGAAPNSGNPPAMFGANDSVSGGGEIFMRQQNTTTGTAVFLRSTSFSVQWSTNAGQDTADDKRHRYCIALAPSNFAVCTEDGVLSTQASGTIPAANRIYIGSQAASSQRWDVGGRVEYFAAWTRRITNSGLQVLSAARNDFFWLCDGDSIPITPAVSQNLQKGFPGVIRTNSPLGWQHQNLCVASTSLGNATAGLDLSGSTRTTLLDDMLTRYKAANPGTKNCTVIFVGHNDFAIDSDSTGTFLTQLAAYADARRTAGHKIALVIVPPSTTSGLNAWRATVNTTILTWVGVHADYVVDLTSVTGCADADASNATLWPDGIHPSATQSSNLAAAVKAQALDLAAA